MVKYSMLVSHDLFLHIAAFVHGAFGAAAAASFLHLSWLENVTLTQSMCCKIDSSRNTKVM